MRAIRVEEYIIVLTGSGIPGRPEFQQAVFGIVFKSFLQISFHSAGKLRLTYLDCKMPGLGLVDPVQVDAHSCK